MNVKLKNTENLAGSYVHSERICTGHANCATQPRWLQSIYRPPCQHAAPLLLCCAFMLPWVEPACSVRTCWKPKLAQGHVNHILLCEKIVKFRRHALYTRRYRARRHATAASDSGNFIPYTLSTIIVLLLQSIFPAICHIIL